MNYRHLYHAGNCADVVKHSVLILLLEHLSLKDKDFCYIDTHAGTGIYDLSSAEANKTKEYQSGVGQIFPQKNSCFKKYRQIIKKFNPNAQMTFYPGSPMIAHALKRPGDRLILNELHPEDHDALRKLLAHEKNILIHH